MIRDYWLSRLCFDLQNPELAGEDRADRAKVLARYPLGAEVRAAVERDDVAYVAKVVNPYLLRFYFHMSGMPEDEFLRQDPRNQDGHTWLSWSEYLRPATAR